MSIGKRVIKTRLAIMLIAAMMLQIMVVFSSVTVYAADYTIGSDGVRTYKLVFDSGLNGYKLQLENSTTALWSSKDGSAGIRVLDSSNNIGSWQYKVYSSVTAITGGYKADVSLTTVNGSVLNITDTYKLNSI
ncbi:hypothetical protein EHS13_11425 [Paenibacillus psychroresistens]|uniref:Uncharacterized protein n=1 Tax=Paenibacillus psychroresistens TaxID=1778678 RepID=A0A6B8RHB1_9BACL|nr:hypothetical protein [Paenibacillus psychroresistens]QGQ95449.1 hypothetical protein EHS13_11425 [Paenibacillus psychroresistens]